MIRLIISILALLLIGCVPHYKNRTEMPAPLQDNLDSVERDYKEMAANTAANITGCSAQEATTTVITSSNEKFMIQFPTEDEKAVFVTEKKIKTMGVSLCGEEFTYEVLCGAGEEYAALVFEYAATQIEKKRSCRIVNEGEGAQPPATDDAAAPAEGEEAAN